VVSDYVVKLRLTRPTRAVLNALAAPAPGAMISPSALKNKDLATHPVGTGAWVIDTFRPGQRVTCKRRGDSAGIWDDRTGKVARVEITSQATDAAYAAVQSGQADIVLSSGDNRQLQSKIDAHRLKLRALPTTMTIAGMFMNQTVQPFDDKRVRQAVNYAIDRTSIVKAFAPTTSPRVQPFPKVLGGFDPALENTYPYDPGKAKALLAEAGYPHGLDAGEFLVTNMAQFPNLAQAVQANLADIGMKIRLKPYDTRQLVTYYSKSGAPGMFGYITFPSIEPGADFTWLYDNPLTMPGGVPKSLVARFGGADDPGAAEQVRASRVAAVNGYATSNALYAPVWQGVPGYVITDKVHGLDDGRDLLAPYGAQDFRYVYLTR
jgi:peptide/nickel transport system substrate-binding protein